MKILLDSQCWRWWMAAPEKLAPKARRLIADRRNTLFFSAASAWEVAIRYSIGKLPLPEPPIQFVPKRLTREAMTVLPIEVLHTLRVAELPLHHRDPFDRLIVSQAIHEGIPILTTDRQFEPYDADIIWA